MNSRALETMGEAELDAYAKVLGIDSSKVKGAGRKMGLIKERRSRCAEMTVLGIDIEVPIRMAHDKRVSDLLAGEHSDAEMLEAVRLLIGDDQLSAIEGACTEDDGVFDMDAFAYAVAAIITNPALKNF